MGAMSRNHLQYYDFWPLSGDDPVSPLCTETSEAVRVAGKPSRWTRGWNDGR
jgi:hypothetical protein